MNLFFNQSSSQFFPLWWWRLDDDNADYNSDKVRDMTPNTRPQLSTQAVKLMYCCPGTFQEKTLLGHPSFPAFSYLDSFRDSFTRRVQSSLILVGSCYFFEGSMTCISFHINHISISHPKKKNKNRPHRKFWVQVSSHPLLGNSGAMDLSETKLSALEWEEYSESVLTRSVLAWSFYKI